MRVNSSRQGRLSSNTTFSISFWVSWFMAEASEAGGAVRS